MSYSSGGGGVPRFSWFRAGRVRRGSGRVAPPLSRGTVRTLPGAGFRNHRNGQPWRRPYDSDTLFSVLHGFAVRPAVLHTARVINPCRGAGFMFGVAVPVLSRFAVVGASPVVGGLCRPRVRVPSLPSIAFPFCARRHPLPPSGFPAVRGSRRPPPPSMGRFFSGLPTVSPRRGCNPAAGRGACRPPPGGLSIRARVEGCSLPPSGRLFGAGGCSPVYLPRHGRGLFGRPSGVTASRARRPFRGTAPPRWRPAVRWRMVPLYSFGAPLQEGF